MSTEYRIEIGDSYRSDSTKQGRWIVTQNRMGLVELTQTKGNQKRIVTVDDLISDYAFEQAPK